MAFDLAAHRFSRPRQPPKAPEAKGSGLFLPAELFDLPGSPYREGTAGSVGLWTAYRLYALAYACMKYRATKLAEAPIWLQDETADGWEWITGDHELKAVLREPNPDMDMAELVELTSLYLDTAGICVWHKVRDRGQRVARLYPYHRDEVEITPAEGRIFGRFRLATMTGSVDVPAEDVVLFKSANPEDWRRGVGPLEAALAHVNIGADMRKAMTAALKNAVRPGAKVEVAEGFGTTEEYERFRERMNTAYAGATNAGKVLILERATMDLLQSGLKDLELGPVQGDVEAAICQCFQVHPALVGARIGLENSSGFADSIGPATDLFYDVFALPSWRRMGSALTRQLLREVDDAPDRRIAFDTTEVRALQDDLTARTKEAQQAAGFWTVDEARVHTGQAPLGDERGEEFVRGAPAPGQTAAPNAEPNDEPPTKRGAKASERQERRDTTRLIEAATRQTEEQTLELLAANELLADEVAVHQALGLHAKSTNGNGHAAKNHEDDPIPPSRRDALAKRVERAVEIRARGWVDTFERALDGVAQRAVQRTSVAVGVDFDLLQPGLLDFVKREAAELVTHVSGTTKDEIRRMMADSFEAGEGVGQMARRFRESGLFDRNRAKLIAVTETTRTRNGASLEAMQDYQKRAPAGVVVTKEWLNSGDSKVRRAHQNQPTGVGGEVVGINETFSNGLQAPSEPNCRCSLLTDVDVED